MKQRLAVPLWYVRAVFQSFYSASLYWRAALSWRGRGFVYLFIVVSLCTIPPVAEQHLAFMKFSGGYLREVIEQMPKIAFRDGELHIAEASPHRIYDPNTRELLIAIDISDTNQEEGLAGAKVLLKRQQQVYGMNVDRTKASRYTSRSVELGRGDMTALADRLGFWFTPINAFVLLAVGYLYSMVGLFITAGFGAWYAKKRNIALEHGALTRVAAIALTPPLVLQMLTRLLKIHVPFQPMVVIAIACMYTWLALRSDSTRRISSNN